MIMMKTIKEGIVFSDDIKRILKGYNALNFNYENNGLIIPNKELIKDLRLDFKNDVNKIFNNKTVILTEEEMLESINNSIKDIRRYPHCIFR